ncbi:MAG: class IIb bacteriocin, lactobin A/cerein 7B family [Candidatus Coprovivens sp.]
MKQLSEKELNNIEGGILKNFTAWGIIGAGVTFIIGIINGYIRPLPCRGTK